MDAMLSNALLAALPEGWPRSQLQLQTLQAGLTWSLSPGEVWFPVTALLGLSHAGAPRWPLPVVGCKGWLPPATQADAGIRVHVLQAGNAYRCDWSWTAAPGVREAQALLACSAGTERLQQQWGQWAHCQRHHETVQGLASWWLHCEAQKPGSAPLKWPEAVLAQWLGGPPVAESHPLQVLRAQGALACDAQGWWCEDPARLARVACACYQTVWA